MLRHSARGMDLLRPHLPEDFCQRAAEAMEVWPRGNVLLTTGFYVGGHAETDGPPGTLFAARALEKMGFSPVVITDEPCRGYFEAADIPVEYVPVDASDETMQDILHRLKPVGLLSIERCGENIQGDYANMRGVSVAAHTAPLDRLFALASCPTVGVGDGGNEIGMGNLAQIIRQELALTPCRQRVDHLIIATVSNWGALGLCAALGHLPDDRQFLEAYALAQELGFVDGVTKNCTRSEDGFDLCCGLELLNSLKDSDHLL